MTDSITTLTPEESLRYGRQIVLPQIGGEGQRKLKSSRVLVVGAGGLGSPIGLYLAAAGVGTLGIVEYDIVDVSNLHRQILHDTESAGSSKLQSAVRRIHALNPYVCIVAHETALSSANAMGIVRKYDMVVDGTDNFPARYLVNDACVLLGIPNVYGSVYRFEGQVSVFDAARGPCYRCLFPEPPAPGDAPNCAEAGVLGVLPGIIGTLQATETIKLITGIGAPLIGRLLLFDALAMRFRTLTLKKNPACPLCGGNPSVTQLIDYEEFCGVKATMEITPVELKQKLVSGEQVVILDVREPDEYATVNLGGTLIPLRQLPARFTELDPAQTIVVHCHHGSRSMAAVQFLRQQGFTHVLNLTGGIDRWARELDPGMRRY